MSEDDNELKIKIEALKHFIYNDDVQGILSSINNNVMDFNILEITGMGNQEIKHSNIIGWLFDDAEHNLEYEILDNFLKKVIKENESDDNSKREILDKLQSYIYLAENKKNITIYREKDNIDILIVDESNKVVIAIENKIFASERIAGISDDGQLSKYEDIINEKFISITPKDPKKGYEKYFIFLTLNLDEPIKGKEYWMKANYQMIADIIDNTLLTKKELSVKTKIVFESYIDLLKRRGVVASNELDELANKIWSKKEYKSALEILIDYKPSKLEDIRSFLKKVKNLTLISETKMKDVYNFFFTLGVPEYIFKIFYSKKNGMNFCICIDEKKSKLDWNWKGEIHLNNQDKIVPKKQGKQYGYSVISSFSKVYSDEEIDDSLLQDAINAFELWLLEIN